MLRKPGRAVSPLGKSRCRRSSVGVGLPAIGLLTALALAGCSTSATPSDSQNPGARTYAIATPRPTDTTTLRVIPTPSLTPTASPTPTHGFTATGSMVEARWGATATLLPNGLVLIAGGWASGNTLASAELYDPATGKFTATGSMTTARDEDTATLLPNGLVLIAGGCRSSCSPGNALASAELYDPATGSFTATGSMTTVRILDTATLLPNGLVLIAGGDYPYHSDNGGFSLDSLASAELYDPATGRFTATGSMATARAGETATLLPNGQVLVAGGCRSSCSPGNALASAELYDPATGKFTATGSMTTVRAGETATLLPNGLVLIAGGGFSVDALASVELYDPATGKFMATGSMTTARHYDTATLLTNGLVLIAGGTDGVSGGGKVVDFAELYQP